MPMKNWICEVHEVVHGVTEPGLRRVRKKDFSVPAKNVDAALKLAKTKAGGRYRSASVGKMAPHRRKGVAPYKIIVVLEAS